MKAIYNPEKIENDELLEWLNFDFDPEEFDIESMNKELAKECK